jgi:hypothetical protein
MGTVSQSRILQTNPQSTTSNVIIARTIKNDREFFMNDEDLQVLLKLRQNRLRIGSLTQDLFDQSEEFSGNKESEDEIIENLKVINNILVGVRARLNEL